MPCSLSGQYDRLLSMLVGCGLTFGGCFMQRRLCKLQDPPPPPPPSFPPIVLQGSGGSVVCCHYPSWWFHLQFEVPGFEYPFFVHFFVCFFLFLFNLSSFLSPFTFLRGVVLMDPRPWLSGHMTVVVFPSSSPLHLMSTFALGLVLGMIWTL